MRSARMEKDYAERAAWVLKEAEQAFGATAVRTVHARTSLREGGLREQD